MIKFANSVYELVKYECKDLDAIYEDYILKLVGKHGFNALLEHGFIESCGVINNRRLYTILERNPLRYPEEYEELKEENETLKRRIKILESYILDGR